MTMNIHTLKLGKYLFFVIHRETEWDKCINVSKTVLVIWARSRINWDNSNGLQETEALVRQGLVVMYFSDN